MSSLHTGDLVLPLAGLPFREPRLRYRCCGNRIFSADARAILGRIEDAGMLNGTVAALLRRIQVKAGCRGSRMYAQSDATSRDVTCVRSSHSSFSEAKRMTCSSDITIGGYPLRTMRRSYTVWSASGPRTESSGLAGKTSAIPSSRLARDRTRRPTARAGLRISGDR